MTKAIVVDSVLSISDGRNPKPNNNDIELLISDGTCTMGDSSLYLLTPFFNLKVIVKVISRSESLYPAT